MSYGKLKIAVYGLGREFQKRKEYLEKNFEVIAYSDTKIDLTNVNQKVYCKNELLELSYDAIVICTSRYYIQIKQDLVDLGIKPTMIYCIDTIKSLLFHESLAEYQNEKRIFMNLLSSEEEMRHVRIEEYPILDDKDSPAGSVDFHYFFQDIIVANRIINSGVKKHYDIASRIDGFVSHLLASGINVVEYDIRDLGDIVIGPGYAKLQFKKGDATNLDSIESDSINSLSSLHAIEHFGLGRYGDALDPWGHIKVMHALQRVLSPGGMLYLSLPVGVVEKVCFNAHRIFFPTTIRKTLNRCTLIEFVLIHNGETIVYNLEEFEKEKFADMLGEYDCGIFMLRKNNVFY